MTVADLIALLSTMPADAAVSAETFDGPESYQLIEGGELVEFGWSYQDKILRGNKPTDIPPKHRSFQPISDKLPWYCSLTDEPTHKIVVLRLGRDVTSVARSDG